jgi:hypothetical protein
MDFYNQYTNMQAGIDKTKAMFEMKDISEKTQ